ncbi:MotA/TolQ/ExbB proton channel family protein [Anaeromyxobacter paludicola]|uniref:MotA/TolQ/ExbB proton channel domain-containing protein n=1 Tax=Anaeromyxobacter paludicola TaxID=2918171 RepID=A0ABM7X8T2_9BACT|nr:MotA/TolQ/ExbB proton channel family protein [Anaeromyxobacter paludicola]BDG08260.1 hypothetical protein AMPC_13730 [Anaeromyxobacter paludicola]
MIQHLADFFREGGPFMFVNLVASAVAVAVIVERFVALGFKLNVDAGPFVGKVVEDVRAGRVAAAEQFAAAAGKAPLAAVLRSGLAAHQRGEDVAGALEEAVLDATPLVSKRISSLWSLANIATLLGLIGTITGLIGTFKSLGAASPEMKQLMLSRGISEAMNNTAFGLGIAVTCIVAHLMLTSKSKAMVEEIEASALKLENALAAAPAVQARGA